MRRLILVRGIPGSGKSALAEQIADGCDGMAYEADQFRYKDGVYLFDKDSNSKAHELCFESMRRAFEIGVANVVVANTFTRHWEMQKYIDYAHKNDIDLVVIKCELNGKSIHEVPWKVLSRMRKRWENFDGEISPVQFFVGEVF